MYPVPGAVISLFSSCWICDELEIWNFSFIKWQNSQSSSNCNCGLCRKYWISVIWCSIVLDTLRMRERFRELARLPPGKREHVCAIQRDIRPARSKQLPPLPRERVDRQSCMHHCAGTERHSAYAGNHHRDRRPCKLSIELDTSSLKMKSFIFSKLQCQQCAVKEFFGFRVLFW